MNAASSYSQWQRASFSSAAMDPNRMMDVGKCRNCCWLLGRLTFCGDPEGGLAVLNGWMFAFYVLVKSLVGRVIRVFFSTL